MKGIGDYLAYFHGILLLVLVFFLTHERFYFSVRSLAICQGSFAVARRR